MHVCHAIYIYVTLKKYKSKASLGMENYLYCSLDSCQCSQDVMLELKCQNYVFPSRNGKKYNSWVGFLKIVLLAALFQTKRNPDWSWNTICNLILRYQPGLVEAVAEDILLGFLSICPNCRQRKVAKSSRALTFHAYSVSLQEDFPITNSDMAQRRAVPHTVLCHGWTVRWI